MDINEENFWCQLLTILRSISNATFVAIDLEMSGIPKKNYGSHDKSYLAGKPSLQDIYEECREAAEKYQVLQIGITCIEEDHEREIYVARPYNFNVSPILMHGNGLEIERDFTFQSSAIHFLMENSFDIGAVFAKGVPYLSSEEECISRINYTIKQERLANIPDIVISPDDVEMTAFVNKARKTICDFSNQERNEVDHVNIGHPNGLNGFMRRLVHQLIHNEFPAYRASARCRGEFMQVEKLDPVREASLKKSKIALYDSNLYRQKGLRYIFEALSGGDLNGFDPKWFSVNNTNEPVFSDIEALKETVQSLQESLKSKKTIIVGHNIFLDLIFLYKTFVSKLPDQVTEFSHRINAFFPTIFDTKYLATQAGDTMQNKSSLKDLYDESMAQRYPLIALDEKHTNYGPHRASKEHEAGYDSWMTAQVFVKLSAWLSWKRGFLVDYRIGQNKPRLSRTARQAFSAEKRREVLAKAAEKKTNGRNSSCRLGPQHRQQSAGAPFADFNIFTMLEVEGQNNSDSSRATSPALPEDKNLAVPDGALAYGASTSDSNGFRRSESSRSTLTVDPAVVSQHHYSGLLNDLGLSDLSLSDAQVNQRMPDASSRFWDLYANYLRVYGTDLEFCYLGPEAEVEMK